jgi:hypothetical protein
VADRTSRSVIEQAGEHGVVPRKPCPGDGRTFEISQRETAFSGIRFGRGPDVVVLSHQIRSSECGFLRPLLER